MFGAKGPGNFLAKLTFLFGTLFVLNTIALGYIYNQETSKSVVDTIEVNSLVPQAPATTPAQSAPAAPTTSK